MATVTEVINRTAGELGILRLNQSLQAQDNTRINTAYDEVYADLKTEGLATWASAGTIPDEVVRHVAALMADNCVNNYGVSDKRYDRIKKDSAVAKREIRKLISPVYVSTTDPADF